MWRCKTWSMAPSTGVMSNHLTMLEAFLSSGRPHIVYVSYDGLLEPLGYSQVVRVVRELSRRGDYRVTVCSLEKQGDRQEAAREQELEARLRARHIRWRRRTFTPGGGPLDFAQNMRAMMAMVDDVVDTDGADLIHARSYVPASVARQVGRRHQVPYLFDTRGYWLDERIERGRFVGGPMGRRAARMWESSLYDDCAGAVVLTETSAREIRDERFGRWPSNRPLSVIPTCVDYSEFSPGMPGRQGGDGPGIEAIEKADPVVGFVGAVSKAYCVDESLRLFDHVLQRCPTAHLVGITRQRQALRDRIERCGLPASSYTIVTVEHGQMPRWLQVMDWGLLLRNTSEDQRAYRGAMPTKLAEFFAGGVRPVYFGHSREVGDWIERAGSGHLLTRLDEEALRTAATTIANTDEAAATDLWGARWRTQAHFGLRSGVERYHRVYQKVIERRRSRRLQVLFLTEGTTVPASRYRVQQLVPHLEKRGIDCTVRPAYGDGYNRWSDTPAAPVYKLACSLQRIPYAMDGDQFDVVFLQRPALPFSAIAERLANWRNPQTIFDVDDAIFVGPDGRERRRQKEAFEQIVDRCAHVICGNEYLAERTRERTPTSVIPTVVDTEIYAPSPGGGGGDGDDPVTIGWMGTASNFDSLAMVAPMLARLVTELEDLELLLVSNRRFEPLDGVDGVEQQQWSSQREVELLRRFDIGLMPLVDNAATRGKCGFKAIQYMAVQTPVVASPVGVNRQLFDDQQAGILAGDVEAFEAAIRELVDDRGRRRAMGRAGRRQVRHHYSVDAVIERYVELLETVARRTEASSVTTTGPGGQRPTTATGF